MENLRKKTNLYSFKRVILSKKSYAKKFAGLNQDLYNLLMTCFDNKIETVKCNPGKETRNIIQKPYITFRLNGYNQRFILRIINALPKENIIITFSFNHMGHKTVTFKALDDSSILFKQINTVIMEEYDLEDIEIMKVYNFVLTLKGKNTNIKMIYDDHEVRYYVNTGDDNILYDLEKKLFPSLEETELKVNLLR